MKIWAHCIVHNEENFIWYSVMSVINYVDKILIWDTGSTDNTVEIIKDIKKINEGKIEFKEMGEVDKFEFSRLRQQMLDESDCDWVILLDGDEVWWETSIKKVIKEINDISKEIEVIVIPMYMALGDIYHYQEESAGQYRILDKKGHLNLRAFSMKIPGLHVMNPYGSEGYFDDKNKPIQEREKIIFLDTPYLHLSHLSRSSKKRKYNKLKYEIGIRFAEDFSYPEVFNLVPRIPMKSPLLKRTELFKIRASFETILRQIKRKIIDHG